MNNDNHIPQSVIEDVREKANVKDVLERLGVSFRRSGHDGEWVAYSPFREDKHLGSFHVNEHKNLAYDFATGESWDAIDCVCELEHKTFHEAVRMLAGMLGIIIDGMPAPTLTPLPKREPPKELPTLLYLPEIMDKYDGHDDINPLICWLRSLPLNQDRLTWALNTYRVGTATRGEYRGWTIWWNLDKGGYVQTGKLMAYLPNGHRDKTLDRYGHEKTTWAHTLWKRAGMYDPSKERAVTCAFGLQLLNKYKSAKVAVVESEKTAVIASTLSDPNELIWIATGGLSSLRNRLTPILGSREIILYPDKDGFEKWRHEMANIQYDHISIMTPEQQGWTEADGPKADIADIIIRVLTSKDTTPGEKAAYQLGHPEKAEDIDDLINTLGLVQQ